jgi:hypothetical protein
MPHAHGSVFSAPVKKLVLTLTLTHYSDGASCYKCKFTRMAAFSLHQ